MSCLFDKAFSAKDKLFLELPPELYADVDSIDIAPAAATRVRYFAGNLRAPNSQRSVGQLIEDLKRQP